jgi:hypothetical protein
VVQKRIRTCVLIVRFLLIDVTVTINVISNIKRLRMEVNPMENKELKYNAEGYVDPTAFEALSHIEAEEVADEKNRYFRLRGCLLRVCELAGFKVEGPFCVRDLRTGKVWRG